MANFYEILNAQPNASFDELKSNYKHLILQCHPDKLLHVAAAANDNDNNDVVDPDCPNVKATYDKKFVTINEAWQTLKDPAKRKFYDAELLLTKFQSHSNIFERLKLADMQRISSSTTDNDDDDDSVEEKEKVEVHKTRTTTTYYTYDCRCGGQYVVDESADNELFGRRAIVESVGDDDYDDSSEVIVECSECSLVIILNG